MKYLDNIAAVAKLKPDFLGFIFHEQSPRYFEKEIPELPKSIRKVGVFVDKSIDFIKQKIEEHKLDCVQLHGCESPEFCYKLKQFYQSTKEDKMLNQVKYVNAVEIIKVFSIKDTFDFSILEPYENVCDYFLFDTKGKLPGGNGYTFNWEVLKNYPSSKPYFLSGGIGLDEVGSIMSFLRRQESRYCHTIDVNSKFEIEPGLKDVEKLKIFKKNVIDENN